MSLATISPLLISFAASLVLYPGVRWLSIRTSQLAFPRKDRWNTKPTPTLGGVGMFFAFALTLLIIYYVNPEADLYLSRWSILLGIAIMFSIGLYDDFKPINPPVKFFFQMLAATVVIFFGNNTIDFFRWPIANIFLTYFWLVGITNAINLLDNMDGLAGGVSFIAAGFLSVFFLTKGYPDLLILTLALAGSILGFLIFNFPPAKIFMGDSGSMVLGFALASLAIARRTQASNIFAIIGVPTLVFLLPILDTGLVAITRILRGQSPTTGGTDHTSHRLVAFGLSERQAVLVLYGIAIISGLASIGIEAWDYDLSLVLIPILLIVLSLFVAYLSRLKVVSAEQNSPNNFTRWLVTLTFKRRIFELFFDLLLIGVSFYLAFWTRYGLNMTSTSMRLFLSSWPIALGVSYASFYFLGVYKGLWRYVGINDLVRFVGASILSGVMTWALIKIIYPGEPYTNDIFLLFSIFLFFGLAASRSSFQILDRIYNRQITGPDTVNVLLYGAEDAGEIALRWILRNPAIGYKVVGFLDDDPLKRGSNIHGVDIIGDLKSLEQVLSNIEVNGIIATTEILLQSPEGEILIAVCREKGIWVRVLRLEFVLTE